jgi:hypothetical protein
MKREMGKLLTRYLYRGLRKDAQTLRPITAGQFAVLHINQKKKKCFYYLFVSFFFFFGWFFCDARTKQFRPFIFLGVSQMKSIDRSTNAIEANRKRIG